ncbi:hypothetical protein LTS10_007279 [Elasticomyces elasticus]|nr:hypothetical protein LTS10_007279 [Elasticomyces elasticus]
MHLLGLADRKIGKFALIGRTPSFYELLQIAVNFERSEPRDGIFAVLGMLLKQPESIIVNYTKSTEALLLEITRYVLGRSNDLDAFHHISHRSDPRGICSWILPYDRQVDKAWDPMRLSSSRFRACTGLEYPRDLGDACHNNDTITLAGLGIDSISFATPVCTVDIYENLGLVTDWLLDAMLSLSNSVEQSPANKMSLDLRGLIDLARVLTIEERVDGRTAEVEDLAVVTRWLTALLCRNAKDGPAPNENALAREAHEAFSFMRLYSRRLFLTAAGRIGLGPRIARTGDIVAVLRGGDVPLILRPLDHEYQIIGEAYVSGIMRGEAVQEAQADGFAEQVFVIR